MRYEPLLHCSNPDCLMECAEEQLSMMFRATLDLRGEYHPLYQKDDIRRQPRGWVDINHTLQLPSVDIVFTDWWRVRIPSDEAAFEAISMGSNHPPGIKLIKRTLQGDSHPAKSFFSLTILFSLVSHLRTGIEPFPEALCFNRLKILDDG